MQVPVIMLPQGTLTQMELFEAIAPEVRCGVKPAKMAVPRHGMMVWHPEAGKPGLFRPAVETHPAIVDIKEWSKRIYGCSKEVIRTLVEAGFVEGEKVSPRSMSINLESWFRHRALMRTDPYFWSDSDNLRRYSEAFRRIRQRAGSEGRDRLGKARRQSGDSERGLALGAPHTPPALENAGNGLGEGGESGAAAGGPKTEIEKCDGAQKRTADGR